MKSFHFRLFICAGLAVFSLFLSSACSDLISPPKAKVRNLICVIDFSSSKNADQRQKFYAQAIKEQIVNNLGPHDKLTILPLDKSSVTNSVEILSEDFNAQKIVPEYGGPKDIKEKTEKNLQEQRSRVQEKFDQAFSKASEARKAESGGTDIIGLLKVLRTHIKPEDKNYIVFFSDMMNYSTELKMEKEGPDFNLKSLDSLVSKATAIDLKGVTVLVLTGDQPDIPRPHFELVQQFWTKYFEKNGASLFDYSSATTSKLNDLMMSGRDEK